MKGNKTGRPNKYSYEVLKECLLDYLKEKPDGKVNCSELSRYSNIPYHIWRDNKQIKSDIDQANKYSLRLDLEENGVNEIFNLLDIFENYHDIDILKNKMFKFSKVYESMYMKCCEVEKIEIENYKLKIEIERLTNENKLLKESVAEEKNELGVYVSVCENRKRISELGLDQSKLQSDLYNEKSVSTDISDLKVFFPQLFK